MDRGSLAVETLLKVVLVLTILWIGLEIVGEVLDTFADLLGPLRPLIGVAIVVLIVLWLLD